MKMMRWFVLLPLLVVLFFGCTENKKAETISYKDIEGYWVSGYLLHNTDLTRSMATGKPYSNILLLRLKNKVNGFADTSFVVSGDTLFYRIGMKRSLSPDGHYQEKEEFYPFRITFHSKDRLILRDDAFNEEMIFYNLSILPVFQDKFKRIAFEEKEIIISDSVEINQYSSQEEKFIFRRTLITNAEWKKDLDTIVSRINWNAALFIRNSNIPKGEIAGEFEIVLNHRPGNAHISIITTKHSGEWEFQSQYVSDPALSVLLEEMRSFEAYCYKKDMLILGL